MVWRSSSTTCYQQSTPRCVCWVCVWVCVWRSSSTTCYEYPRCVWCLGGWGCGVCVCVCGSQCTAFNFTYSLPTTQHNTTRSCNEFLLLQIPLQNNSSDCGLFMLQYVESLLLVSCHYNPSCIVLHVSLCTIIATISSTPYM